MNDSPLDRGVTMTLTWGGGAYRVRRSLPVGAAFRVAAALALCAACYEAGRWHGGLEAMAERTSARPLVAAQSERTAPAVEAPAGTQAPGQAVGEPEEVITPLNVRDPSALVMPPALTEPSLNSVTPPPVPPPLPDPKELLHRLSGKRALPAVKLDPRF